MNVSKKPAAEVSPVESFISSKSSPFTRQHFDHHSFVVFLVVNDVMLHLAASYLCKNKTCENNRLLQDYFLARNTNLGEKQEGIHKYFLARS